jgi:hypothetical protein
MKLLIPIIILLFNVNSLFSQTTITGYVIEEDANTSLPGVKVLEKGTENSEVTDSRGFYSITVKDSSSILIFSFIGMIDREIKVNGQNVINTSLKAYTIYEAWDQKLRFFLNSGVIENPFGGQLEFAMPTFINALSLYGNCSFQTNFKGNKYYDAGLKLNGVRLFYSSDFYFGVGIESNYRHILFNSSTIETISFESIWWSSLPFYLIAGYNRIKNDQNSQFYNYTKNGIVLGAEYWIPKPVNVSVTGKASFLNELLEYQAELRKTFGKYNRVHSFVKYHNVDSYSELSIGLGIEFTYYFKHQNNEY